MRLTQKHVFNSGEYFVQKYQEEKYQKMVTEQTDKQLKEHYEKEPGDLGRFDSATHYRQISMAKKKVEEQIDHPGSS